MNNQASDVFERIQELDLDNNTKKAFSTEIKYGTSKSGDKKNWRTRLRNNTMKPSTVFGILLDNGWTVTKIKWKLDPTDPQKPKPTIPILSDLRAQKEFWLFLPETLGEFSRLIQHPDTPTFDRKNWTHRIRTDKMKPSTIYKLLLKSGRKIRHIAWKSPMEEK